MPNDVEEGGALDASAAEEAARIARVDWWTIFGGEHEYTAQREFVNGSDRLHQIWLGGRGTGKTWGLMLKALWLALRNPGEPRPGGSYRLCEGAMFGRTAREIDHKLAPYFEEHLRTFQDATGINLLAWYSGKFDCYTLINGARIYKLSYGRADALKKDRGYTLGWAVMDEVEHAEVNSRDAFEIVLATLRHPLAKESTLAVATSPNGLRGVTAHFLKKLRAGDPNYYAQTATVYDNPYVDDVFRERLKSGCSPRMWRQEGLGEILRPVEAIYDFEEGKHLIDWRWRADLPYILGIDWGEAHAYACAIQIDENSGRWVVARERKMEDGSRPKFREVVLDLVRECARAPYMIATDRAVRSENNWAMGTFSDVCEGGIRWAKSRTQQHIAWGVGAVEYMLNPPAGKGIGQDDDPRLVFSRELSGHLETAGRGLRGAMINYRYRRRRMDTGEYVITNDPETNTPNCHPCDALRYAVISSVYDEKVHGGRVLPYVEAHPLGSV